MAFGVDFVVGREMYARNDSVVDSSLYENGFKKILGPKRCLAC